MIRNLIEEYKKISKKKRWVETLIISMAIIASCLYLGARIHSFENKLNVMMLNVSLEPLGIMNVSQYSHLECGGNLYTASSYKLKPDVDSQRVCAVSRDIWQTKLKQGDIIYIKELDKYLTCVDTMAVEHPTFKTKQKNWIDVYESDLQKVNEFGLKKLTVYRLRR